jgi:hypothetical protein
MASRKRGKPTGKPSKRELEEMDDDTALPGEAADLGDDENPVAGERDEVVEVTEIEGELIPEASGSEELEAQAQPTSSGTGRGKEGGGRERRQRRASKPRTAAKAKSGRSSKKKR